MIEEGYQKDVLDHGYVKLLKYLGTDQYIADTARVSTNSNGKSLGLVTRLVSDRHTSPIEFAVAQFEIKAPLFVFREWHRHRTFSYSELSARFGKLPEEYYVPTLERLNPQHSTNKQMSDENKIIIDAEKVKCWYEDIPIEVAHWVKDHITPSGLARELEARLYPQTRFTVCRTSANLWNWMHFLDLRTRPDAQFEIRQYAIEIQKILKELFPVAMEAWEEHIRYAQTFSRTEVELLKKGTYNWAWSGEEERKVVAKIYAE